MKWRFEDVVMFFGMSWWKLSGNALHFEVFHIPSCLSDCSLLGLLEALVVAGFMGPPYMYSK
ncbi:unnamed protein product [Prunus armeniaca]